MSNHYALPGGGLRDVQDYAQELILQHAKDIEFLTVHEMWDGEEEITDEQAKAAFDLIRSATVKVWWD